MPLLCLLLSVPDGVFDLLPASILLPRLPLQGVGRDKEYFGRGGRESFFIFLSSVPTELLFGKQTSGRHCLLIPSAKSPLQQTITPGATRVLFQSLSTLLLIHTNSCNATVLVTSPNMLCLNVIRVLDEYES